MNRTIPVVPCLFLLSVAVSLAVGGIACNSPAFAQTALTGQTPTNATTPPVPTPAAQVDAAAMTLLEKSQKKMFGLKTFRAECWASLVFTATPEGKPRPNRYTMSTLVAAKPNLMRYDNWTMNAPSASAAPTAWRRQKTVPDMTFASNGKTVWKQFGSSYRKDDRAGADDMYTILEPWEGFYSKNSAPLASLKHSQQRGELLDMRLEGTETVEGVVCGVVHYHMKTEYSGETQEYDTRLYIGSDGIIRRRTETIRFGGKPGYTRDSVLRNIVTNAPIVNPSTVFAYTPPKGVKLEIPAKDRVEPPLLANGTTAPDFAATDTDGTVVKLSDLRGKVVVVDFWASWCPPCVASMPHNQKVIQKLQAEGLPVVLLAVDNSEGRDAFAGWVAKHTELDALRFVHADPKALDIVGKLYQVTGIPTQYIIDANGVIRSSSVGFGGETDEMEKAIRAVLALPPK